MASAGAKPHVIVSSGTRLVDGNEGDAGVMAFRTDADLINVMVVVMKFDRKMAFDALHRAGTFALQQAHIRRFGKQSITIAGIQVTTESELKARTTVNDAGSTSDDKTTNPVAKQDAKQKQDEKHQDESSSHHDEDDYDDDGFVALDF